MNTSFLRFLAIWLCCICSSLALKAQTISSGTSPVCKGNTGSYTVTGGPALTVSYEWHVTTNGALTSPNNGSTVTVLWGLAGATSVSVDAKDALGSVLGTATFPVTVSALPLPTLTSNVRVGCQVWTDSPIPPDPEHPSPAGDPTVVDDGQGCVKVCEFSPVVYTASGGSGSTYTWTIAGGTPVTATGNVIVVDWGAAGSGNVTVTETTPQGCVGTRQVCIEKIEKPVVKFYEVSHPGMTSITACLEQTLYFQDLSIGSAASPIVEWIWDFGDGTTMTSLTSTTIPHTYHQYGTFKVILTVKNACGCTAQELITVDVSKDQGVKIVCPAVVCEGDQGTYSLDATGPGCSHFNWSATGGTLLSSPTAPTATINWNSVGPSGFGYVNFDASGCGISCPGITTVKIPVIQAHGTIAGPTVVCPNSQALFNLPQWPSTVFTWSVPSFSTPVTLVQTDQNNQIAVNIGNHPGHFTLVCNYTNTLLGCSGSAIIDVNVLPPDAITGSKIVCLGMGPGMPYQLVSGSSGNWTLSQPDGSTQGFSGSSFNPILTQTGTYSLSVTGAFCSPEPLVIRVNALPPAPDSIVGPNEACFGAPTPYKAGGPLLGTVFTWSVSGGSTVNPVTTLNSNPVTSANFSGGSPATITVVRTTIDEAKCNSAPISMQVYQPSPSGAIVGVDTVCPSTAYPFTFPYAKGEIYEWKLKSSSVGSVQGAGDTENVEILFNQTTITGVADTIKLRIWRCGSYYDFSKPVYVRGAATPVITLSNPSPLCRGAAFFASAGIPGMATWDWGDGSPTTSANAHSYTALTGGSGNLSYTISVEVANPFGCPGSATATLPVTVLPAPVVQVSPGGPVLVCNGAPNTVLTATLQNGYEPTAQLEWFSVGAGSLTSCIGAPPTCTYTVGSLDDYYVVATGTNGCTSTSNVVHFTTDGCGSNPAVCTLTPDATVSVTGTVDCGHATLTGSYSSSAPTTAINWDWDAPSAALSVVSTNTSFDADFKVAGVYPVTYIVTFNDGVNTCTRRQTVNVTVPLVAEMGYEVVCNGSNNGYDVKLIDHSNYYPPYAPQKYEFWLDGLQVATVYPPANSYPLGTLASGPHNFKTVTYYSPTESCESVASFDVPQTPVASFTADSLVTCVKDQAVDFINASTGTDLTYLWSFGDGPTNTTENPYRLYNSTGMPDVILTVTDKYGCQSSTNVTVTVLPNEIASAFISASQTAVCSGTPINLQYFLDLATTFPLNYSWMNGDDLLYTNNLDHTTVYSSGAYWVKGSNAIGCRVSTAKVNVNVNEVPQPGISGDAFACLNQSYTLYGYAGTGVTYTWKRNGVVVGTNQDSYTETATTVGTVSYTLTLTATEFGITCSKTSIPFIVTVNPPPAPPTISFNISHCDPYIVDLFASGSGIAYNWSNGTTGSHVTAQGGGAFGVYMTDANGCRSHASVDVPKDPRAYLWMFPTGCYTFCDNTLPRIITGPIETFNFWSWLQNLNPVLSQPGSPAVATPVQSYSLTSAGIYNLELGNLYCQNIRSEDMVVDIVPCGSSNGCGTLIIFGETEFHQTGPCEFDLYFTFNSSISATVSLSVSAGSLSVGGAVVNPGFNMQHAVYYPPAGWGGGFVTFTMTYTDPSTGEQYTCTFDRDVPPCEPHRPGNGARMAAPGSNGTTGSGISARAGLWLVPNPASSATRAEYVLHSGTREGSLEVYDVTGRLMSRTVVDGKNTAGSVTLSLGDYVPGLYLVVLKEEGRITQQSRLTIVH